MYIFLSLAYISYILRSFIVYNDDILVTIVVNQSCPFNEKSLSKNKLKASKKHFVTSLTKLHTFFL